MGEMELAHSGFQIVHGVVNHVIYFLMVNNYVDIY